MVGDLKLTRHSYLGAGAAGSSTAYHLRQYAGAQGLNVNITIYERSSYIGGRSTTVDVLDDPAYPVELGASIFVRVNEILYNASQAFGLPLGDALSEGGTDSDYDFGIWDGKSFVYRQPTAGPGWWDMAKLFWRYGLAPVRTQRLMHSTISSFLQMYQEPLFPFTSLTEASEQVGLHDFTSSTGSQTLKKNGIGEKWAREIVQSSTRVNYGQNLGTIHGLETMVCMATDDAMSIRGGNWRIFDSMVKASRANVVLDTAVTSIETTGRKTYAISTTSTSTSSSLDTSTSDTEHDIVVLAAPAQFSNISLPSILEYTPDKIPYVKLHVTLLATPHLLSPTFFNIDNSTTVTHQNTHSSIPSMILTTLPSSEEKSPSDLGTDGVGPTGYWSVNHLRTITASHASNALDRDLHVYKIFSPAPMNSSFISSMFNIPSSSETASLSSSGDDDDSLTTLPSAHFPWKHTHTWHSYPYLFPRVTFEHIRLDKDQSSSDRDDDVMGSFFYTSGIESFISTMETSALMGRNVAKLITNGLATGEGRG